MVKHRILLKILLAIMLMSLLNSIGLSAYIPPGIPRHEILILENFHGRVADPTLWNAWVPGGYILPQGYHQLCLDTLWYINYTDGSLIYALAKGPPEYNENFTKLTIRLREGIYWSSGVEFTAEDYVFTLKFAMNETSMIGHPIVKAWIKDVYALDKYTFVIEFVKPAPYFWSRFTVDVWSLYGNLYPLPKHYVEKELAAGKSFKEIRFYPPICLGPYVLKEHDPAGYWFLWERREDWERTSVGKFVKEKGLPWVGPKYVLFIAFDTEEARIAAMVRNELDYIFDLTTEGWEALRKFSPTARSWNPNYPWFYPYEPCVRGIFFNLDVYPYNITEVRLALMLAIDMADLIIGTYGGLQKAFPVPVPHALATMDLWGVLTKRLEELTITLPNGTKFKVFDPEIPFKIAKWAVDKGYLKEIPPAELVRMIWGPGWFKYAPDVAETLLKSVGFYRGPDGLWRLPDGRLWILKLDSAGPWEIDAMRMSYGIAEQWRRFGIRVDVTVEDYATFWPGNYYGYYDVCGGWCQWGGGYLTTMVLMADSHHSMYYKPIGEYSSNMIRVKDPVFDKLIEKVVSAPVIDPKTGKRSKELLEALVDFQMYTVEKVYMIPTVLSKKLPGFDTKYWDGFATLENTPISGWTAYYFMGAKWLLPYLRPKVAPTPVTPVTPITPTPTPTPPPTPATVTVTVTTTVTVPTYVTDWGTTAVIGIILLIVGVVVGLAIGRVRTKK